MVSVHNGKLHLEWVDTNLRGLLQALKLIIIAYWWKITPSQPHRVQLACSRQWGSWVDTWMSISANILLFGETLFCQYLCKIAMDHQSVKKHPKYLTLPHLLDTYLSSIFNFKKVYTCLPTFPLCNAQFFRPFHSSQNPLKLDSEAAPTCLTSLNEMLILIGESMFVNLL